MATAYYASKISPSQFETPLEGYRICKNVAICRTGYQDYLGSELKKHQAYEPAWNLDDDTTYKVFRPIDEVTKPQTIASFEGKTIADEHPDGNMHPGSLVHLDNERELSCGHMQNVRVGQRLGTGETPLVADLHVKDGDLIDKIDQGVRDVSCGYTYVLKRAADGSLIQTNIRGNHIAVVQRGRAGADISIQDAQPGKESTAMDAITEELHNFIMGAQSSIGEEGLEELYEDDDTPEERQRKEAHNLLLSLMDPDRQDGGSLAVDGARPSPAERALASRPFDGVSYDVGLARYQNSLAMDANSPELPANHFFAGVPYHRGKKAHDEYLAKRLKQL